MKKYLKVILVPSISILVIPLIFSIINLFKVEISPIIYLIILILICMLTGFLLGSITNKKAYLKGIILGLILSAIMFLVSLIMRSHYTAFSIIYYLIIITSCTMGSIIGISKKIS